MQLWIRYAEPPGEYNFAEPPGEHHFAEPPGEHDFDNKKVPFETKEPTYSIFTFLLKVKGRGKVFP